MVNDLCHQGRALYSHNGNNHLYALILNSFLIINGNNIPTCPYDRTLMAGLMNRWAEGDSSPPRKGRFRTEEVLPHALPYTQSSSPLSRNYQGTQHFLTTSGLLRPSNQTFSLRITKKQQLTIIKGAPLVSDSALLITPTRTARGTTAP